MLCQSCNKNYATIHYKSNNNGNITELHLCEDCAEKNGYADKAKKIMFEPFDNLDGFFDKQSEGFFGGLFEGLVNGSEKVSIQQPKVCPDCGMRFPEFLHNGKIGCATCYEIFSSSLDSTIKKIHGNVSHCGKVPAGTVKEDTVENKLALLNEKLKMAIQEQEYEKAAEYRDEIRAIEKEQNEQRKKNGKEEGEQK